MVAKSRARKKVKIRRPIKAFPGDILFFVRALELLRGLCTNLQVRQSPLTIMADSAKSALKSAHLKHDNRYAFPVQNDHPLWPKRKLNINLQRDVKRLVHVLREEGLVSSCQVCVVHENRIVVDVAEGPVVPGIDDDDDENDDEVCRSVRSDSIYSSFSCTKALVATCMHMLVGEGKAKYDDKVSKHWKAFGQSGKSNITIEEMLSHRAGLHAAIPAEMSLQMFCDWDRMCTFFETACPADGYDDGMARYHALTYGWICGKLIELLNGGIPFGEYVRLNIARPLGLEAELMVGVPTEWTRPSWDKQHDEISQFHSNRLVYLDRQGGGGRASMDVSKDEIKDMIERIKKRTKKAKQKNTPRNPDTDNDEGTKKERKELSKQEKMEEMMGSMLETFKGKEWMMDNRMWNSRRVRNAIIPAANGHFSARGLAIFYHALMEDGRLLSSETLSKATAFSAKDFFFGGEFSMGFKRHKYQMEGEKLLKIGFGHAGAGGSIGLAIPHANLSFSLTVSRPIQDAEPRRRILNLICKRLGVGIVQTEEMSGIN
jgi:aarF domain-containing kinase